MIVLDMEMSGLDIRRNSILSIGAVDFNNPGNQFYMECRLRKYGKFDSEALAVNGFTEKGIRDRKKPSEENMLREFCKWMDSVNDRTIAGHNVQFDIRFLKHALYKYGIDYKVGSRCVDTYALAYINMLKGRRNPPMKENRADITSNVVFRYCGLDREPDPHNALTGAKMMAESISRIVYGRSIIDEFGPFRIPDYLKQ
ncbi:MAG: 3'-5' exonuclease [Candidatus Micrarchaeota archaeon]|nr:3'-5' exonuclease [Candidatus Micrarchaeota archaeon]